MKQSVTVGAQLLWGGRYGCNNGRYGCTIVMSYIEINKAVSQWLLTFNLCVSVTWPLTCAFHIPCTHTPEIIDMHRGVCDNTTYHHISVCYFICSLSIYHYLTTHVTYYNTMDEWVNTFTRGGVINANLQISNTFSDRCLGDFLYNCPLDQAMAWV